MIRRFVLTILVSAAAFGACSSSGGEQIASTSPATLSTTATLPAPEVSATSTSVVAKNDANSQCLELAIFGEPAESSYLLPFPVGEGSTILQSYCTKEGSHYRQLAYDFLMPIGSDVSAARGGRVVDVKEDAFDNTGTNFFNYIVIGHADGTLGFYAHLTHEGSLVEVGDLVVAGDHIGVSGASGRTHQSGVLHFGVMRPIEGAREVEIPVVFRNSEGQLDQRGGLRAGTFYKALPDPGQP